MLSVSYIERRHQVEDYFDRTAVEAWSRLTSDAPVGHIRATVRAGRDQMRQTLLSWLPTDLRGRRLLDAGCGTGALAIAAARRGAEVVAVDLSTTLVALAQKRAPRDLGAGRVTCSMRDLAVSIMWSEWIRLSTMASPMRWRRSRGWPRGHAIRCCSPMCRARRRWR
jgi:magnesium-protoporphyrin O-methyltransferase